MVLGDMYSEFQPGVLGTHLPKWDRQWEPFQDTGSFHLVATREWMREVAWSEEVHRGSDRIQEVPPEHKAP